MRNELFVAAFAVAIVAILLFAGCVIQGDEGTGPIEYWDAAYDYEYECVNTTAGNVGMVDTFKYEETIFNDDGKIKYTLVGKYEGVQSTVIRGEAYDYDTGGYNTTVVGTVNCTVLMYNVTRDEAPDSYQDFPAWYSCRIYMVKGSEVEAQASTVEGYWAKFYSWDADGNTYLWENPDAVEQNSDYTSYTEGQDDQNIRGEVIWHLYGTFWGNFLAGYNAGFRDGKWWSIAAGTAEWSHSTDKTQMSVGTYTFDAWEAKSKWENDQDVWTNKAVICRSLCIPLLFQWRAVDEGDTTSFQYELVDITFRAV